MATIIDELIVTLGLDSTKFRRETQQTQSAIQQSGAGAARQGRELEDATRKQQQATHGRLVQIDQVGRQTFHQFNRLRLEVTALFATLATGYGIQQFIKNLTSSEAATGRLAATMSNMTTREFSTWTQALVRSGASMQSAQNAIVGIHSALSEWQLDRKPTDLIAAFTALHIPLEEANGKLRPMVSLFRQIGDELERMSPEQQVSYARRFNLDPDVLYGLTHDREKNLAEVEKRGPVTEEDTKRGQAFVETLADFLQTVDRLKMDIGNELLPVLKEMLTWFDSWIQASRTDWAKEFKQGFEGAIKWIGEFLAESKKVVDAIGGWTTAVEIFFGLWLASKVSPVISAITGIIGLLTGGGGLVMALGAVAAAFALMYTSQHGGMLNPDAWAALLEKFGINTKGGPAGGLAFQRGGVATDERMAEVRDELARRLGISKDAAAGMTQSLNAESNLVSGIQERGKDPLSGNRGGLSWAQWTDTQGSPRRTQFEAFTRAQGLEPSSDEANYRFLEHELKNTYPAVLEQLRRGDISPKEAASVFTDKYIVPGVGREAHIHGAEGVAALPSAKSKEERQKDNVDFLHRWNIKPAPPQLPVTPSPDQQMGTSPIYSPSSYDPSLFNSLQTPPAAASIVTTTSNSTNDNSRSATHSNQVDIHQLVVQSPTSDAQGHAQAVASRLRRMMFIDNPGLA